MSTDKALADVKPGGMVRLGDQAERAKFEAWVKNHVSSLARAADGDYASNFTHALWSAWQAALAAQPSPGGQGDARRQWLEVRGLAAGIVKNLQAFADSPHKGAWCGALDDALSFADQIEKDAAAAYESILAARQPVGEPVAATDAMVEAALQSTVANNASPWRQVVASEDHADFISDMRAAINAALAARPSPITAEATTTSTQTVPDHCDRIFWQHNYYQLPIGPTDHKKPTKRRQAAVETVLSLGYLWRNDEWTAPPAKQPAQAVDLGQFRPLARYVIEQAAGTRGDMHMLACQLQTLIDRKADGNV